MRSVLAANLAPRRRARRGPVHPKKKGGCIVKTMHPPPKFIPRCLSNPGYLFSLTSSRSSRSHKPRRTCLQALRQPSHCNKFHLRSTCRLHSTCHWCSSSLQANKHRKCNRHTRMGTWRSQLTSSLPSNSLPGLHNMNQSLQPSQTFGSMSLLD